METELCPFPIEIHEVLTGTYTVHLDADGDFVRAEVHIAYDADLSANGITLHESDRWTDFYFPGGTHRKVGQLAHVSGPGGLVVNDAGILFTVGGDDVVVDHHGRVTEFIGEVLCPALQGG
ncbi:hypothetical protein [Geodermatophilus saharensis]|uniref:hypothetical protein n=1 Tax=Geodermatophilus saharensis TaxID=1137994 RepID=UPI00113FE041|nr:hypothetical protein [Geodermatophilus saharensis]